MACTQRLLSGLLHRAGDGCTSSAFFSLLAAPLQRCVCGGSIAKPLVGVKNVTSEHSWHRQELDTARVFVPDLHFFRMTLTEKIRERLKASGFSRNKVHQATGLTRATVAAFLDGKDAHSSTLDKLAEFLGMTVAFPAIEAAKRNPKKQDKPANKARARSQESDEQI
jgi:predicted XRE-type DNA-binding protein